MNLSTKPNWTRVEIQARIDPPQTPLNKEVTKNAKECNIIKINMRRDPASAMSKTYKLKIGTVRKPQTRRITQVNEEPQEHDLWDRNYVRVRKNQIYTYYATWINLRKFDYLAIQVLSTTNAHMNVIKESLLEYFPQPMHFPTRSA